MGEKFFKENTTVTGNYEVAEAGTYTCRLKEVIKEKGTSFEDPTVQIDQLKWVFETTEAMDSKDEPYRFTRFTGVIFGGDRANLTKLIDSMFGRRLTTDEYEDIELDDLKAKKWKVMVDETTNQKGNQVNKIVSVKPVMKGQNVATAQARPKPKVEDDDPFAE